MSAELQHLLDQHQFIEFDEKLLATDPKHLTEAQNLYFSGMLAFRIGQLDEAATRLVRAVNTDAEHSLTPGQDREALGALGEINLKASFFRGAAKMFGILAQALGSHPGADKQAVVDNGHLAELLATVPPQKVELTEGFTLTPAGTLSPAMGAEYPVSIPGQGASAPKLRARFDTGAELSVLSASTAKAWGVTMLEGTAMMLGAGGGLIEAHPGFVPALTIGKAQFHHVAVYVLADKDLPSAPLHLQMTATLGFPVLHRLGRLTFRQDGSLEVAAHSPERDPHSATLWLDDHALLIELGTRPVFQGSALTGVEDHRLFTLDTGSASTLLTDRYVAEHKDFFAGPAKSGKLFGVDGMHALGTYEARGLPLFIGNGEVFVLNGPLALAQPMNGPAEAFFGIIGQDVLRQLPGYTLDFRTMTFTALNKANPLPAAK